jgi:phosphoserine aminotransferase
MVYDLLDNSDGFFNVLVSRPYRSRINIVFTCADKRHESLFIEEAKKLNIINIKGHVSKGGGFRASIYSAMPMGGVKALCKHIAEFKERVTKDKALFK